MIKVKRFFTDAIFSLIHFAYEGLIIITYFLNEIITSLYKFFREFIIPSLIDLMVDLVYLSRTIRYEMFYFLSSFCLKVSQILANFSKLCLEKAGEISYKKAW